MKKIKQSDLIEHSKNKFKRAKLYFFLCLILGFLVIPIFIVGSIILFFMALLSLMLMILDRIDILAFRLGAYNKKK